MRNTSNERGFTILELLFVVVIALILAAFGLPQVMSMIHTYRLRGAGTNLAGAIQTVRWRAVQDDTYYSMIFTTANGPTEAYVNVTSGATPTTVIQSEVTMKAASSAPSTTNLKALILPSGSTATVLDGYSTTATNAVTFGPRGLPCKPFNTDGGTVCNTAGGTYGYWVFFQDASTQKWGAVTVTPAGRIQVWYYENSWALNQV